MAKYKKYSYEQARFIPIHFDKQILPGTFEYTLSYLIDNEIDLSLFDSRYNNDETGAPAYDPSILLKIVLYAYSRGIVSSRKIASLLPGEYHLHGLVSGYATSFYNNSRLCVVDGK
jgi:transposase